MLSKLDSSRIAYHLVCIYNMTHSNFMLMYFRFLNPGDLPEVKRLCSEWFPIEYPDAWYADITSTHKFYSVAAVYRGQIVGLVVAEIKDCETLPKEDSEILASTFGSGTKIGYILSLGSNTNHFHVWQSFSSFEIVDHSTSSCLKEISLNAGIIISYGKNISFFS